MKLAGERGVTFQLKAVECGNEQLKPMSSNCQRCKETFVIHDGFDVSDYCDECAQIIAMKAAEFVEKHKEDYELLKTSDSMDNDPEFLNLCEAVLGE